MMVLSSKKGNFIQYIMNMSIFGTVVGAES